MRTLFAGPCLITTIILLVSCGSVEQTPQPTIGDSIALPPPVHESGISVEQALLERRSIREYSPEPLTLTDISHLLWAAQGITNPSGFRTSPSAGGLYPLEIFLLAGEVTDLEAGIYRYQSETHELRFILEGDHRQELSRAALNQPAVLEAPVGPDGR